MLEFITKPWPWYISGPLIGLMVPGLLLIGNKSFGLSSGLRHICAMCTPVKIDFFSYNWKNELWNVVILLGIVAGGFVAGNFLSPSVDIHPETLTILTELGIKDTTGINPSDLFSWSSLTEFKGILLLIFGGFLVGFGSRYGDGCTSGHAIMGLSILNWPSLIAVIGFFVGGLTMTHLILPYILAL